MHVYVMRWPDGDVVWGLLNLNSNSNMIIFLSNELKPISICHGNKNNKVKYYGSKAKYLISNDLIFHIFISKTIIIKKNTLITG